MPAHLQSLEMLRAIIASLDKEQYVEQYPGFYLLAVGFLTAEEISRGDLFSALARDQRQYQTVPLQFEDHPRYDMKRSHPLAGHLFHLTSTSEQECLTAGRGRTCQLIIPDPSVSEEHCRIQLEPDGLVVMDLGSTNGTSVNLKRLSPDQVELLDDGDILTLGRYSFQLLAAPTLYSTLALIRALDTQEPR